VILAVEAFEGTDETLTRAGRLGGAGVVVVKIARPDHDLRYDIPVVGLNTLATLKKIKAAVLAVEARRTILLEKELLIAAADQQDLTLIAVETQTINSKFQIPNTK
ncbi:MAG: LpxI family protein, partial [Lentisphaerae bacterium]|nr:LpxI family protein [Lentisphaerota bacterium]